MKTVRKSETIWRSHVSAAQHHCKLDKGPSTSPEPPHSQVMVGRTKLTQANRLARVTQKSQSEDVHLNFLTLSPALLSAQFSSVQLSRSVLSDSLRPHESQHARPPCPSPTPGVHSDSHPSSQWCHPAISSSVIPFSSCPQSFPASESFPMSQLFAWGGQSTGLSASAFSHSSKYNFTTLLIS